MARKKREATKRKSTKRAAKKLPLAKDLARWEKKTLGPAAERSPERAARFETVSGRETPRLATPLDLASSGWDFDEDVGFPGEFPFTRGVQPTVYRGRLWTMRQYAGFGSAEESNARYKMLLASGSTGLSVAFDLPTQIGYDSDDPIAAGEVGKVGVAVASREDMETLFAGIRLDKVTTSMTINAPAAVLLAMYVATAEKQDVPMAKLGGTVQNDILKEYIARGTYIFPPKPSLRLITDLFEYAGQNIPRWNTISVSGYHVREAGATAAQELAFTLADGVVYVEAARERGLDTDTFAKQMSFFFNAHIDVFEEVAKFRAARRMWAKIMRERFGATDPESWKLRFHTQTAGSSLTAQQPENNVVRTTLEALAAVLGGTQSLHTNSMDEALALPSEKAARIALRTQQILAHESGVANTIDPTAGAYFIEALTDRLEAEAWDLIADIDRRGGMLQAIESGWVAKQIADAAYRYQKALEDKSQTQVGVNAFLEGDDAHAMETLRVAPEIERRQVERLRAFRARRDVHATERTLDDLRYAARGEDNLFPFILAAVRADATTGEICRTLREVWGEYRPRADV